MDEPVKKCKFCRFFKIFLLIIVSLFVILYLAVTVAMTAMQTKFIFPGHAWQGLERTTADLHCAKTENDRLIELTTVSGVKTLMRFMTQPAAEPVETAENADSQAPSEAVQTDENAKPATVPTVLFIYGNGGCLAWSDEIMVELYKGGANVACIEWPGFGIAEGTPSERGCYEAEQAAYDYLVGTEKIDPSTLFVMGHSLGTGPAAHLASTNRVGGVILAAGYTTIPDVSAFYYPYLPCKWVVVHKFATIKKIPNINAPILLIHSKNDKIIPFFMSERNVAVAEKAGKTVDFLQLDEAGHDLFFKEKESPLAWERINAFVHSK